MRVPARCAPLLRARAPDPAPPPRHPALRARVRPNDVTACRSAPTPPPLHPRSAMPPPPALACARRSQSRSANRSPFGHEGSPRQMLGRSTARAGDAGNGDVIDEARTAVHHLRQARIIGGGRDKPNEVQPVRLAKATACPILRAADRRRSARPRRKRRHQRKTSGPYDRIGFR